MARFKLWTLSQHNTSPFVIVAVLYFLFLGSPFICFLYLHGQQNYISEQYYEELNNYDAAQNSNATNTTDNKTLETKKEEIIEYDWTMDKESGPFVLLTRLGLFSAVLAFGAIGSAVSLITRARNKGEVGKITALELISIQTIGAIFACLLTLIFISDFIGGRLFPEPELFYRIIYVHPAFAKLLIWSFIAGFSERFVPNILNNLVKESKEKEGIDEKVEM